MADPYIEVNITWTETNKANVTRWLYNQTNLVNQTYFNSSNYTTFLNYTGLPNANVNYTVNATAYDSAGNSHTIDRNISVLLDTEAPQITSFQTFRKRTTWITVNWTATDEHTIEEYHLKVVENGTGDEWLTWTSMGTDLNYTIRSLYDNTEYTFTLNATDNYDNTNTSAITISTLNAGLTSAQNRTLYDINETTHFMNESYLAEWNDTWWDGYFDYWNTTGVSLFTIDAEDSGIAGENIQVELSYQLESGDLGAESRIECYFKDGSTKVNRISWSKWITDTLQTETKQIYVPHGYADPSTQEIECNLGLFRIFTSTASDTFTYYGSRGSGQVVNVTEPEEGIKEKITGVVTNITEKAKDIIENIKDTVLEFKEIVPQEVSEVTKKTVIVFSSIFAFSYTGWWFRKKRKNKEKILTKKVIFIIFIILSVTYLVVSSRQ